MTDLRKAIKTCAERLDEYRRPGQRIGEQNTKIMLIEPGYRPSAGTCSTRRR